MASRQNKKPNQTTDNVGLVLIESEATNCDTHSERPAFAEGDLGKVQELLFGQQLNSTTHHIETLKARMDEQFKQASAESLARFNELSDQSERKFASLTKQLDAELDTKNTELVQVKDEIKKSQAELRKIIAAVENRANEADEARRNELLRTETTWSTSLEKTREQLQQQLKEASDVLHEGKLDRSALSGLLGTIASQLTNTGSPLADASTEARDASSSR